MVVITASYMVVITASYMVVITSSYMAVITASYMAVITASYMVVITASYMVVITASYMVVITASNMVVITASYMHQKCTYNFCKYHKSLVYMSSATSYGECCSVSSVEEGTSSTSDMIQQVTASGSLLYRRIYIFFPWCNSSQWARASSLSRLHDHTQTHHTR
jgi:hypothetical protein